jgi:hypothetical protein
MDYIVRDALIKSKSVNFTKTHKYVRVVPARAGSCGLPARDGFVESALLDLFRGSLGKVGKSACYEEAVFNVWVHFN